MNRPWVIESGSSPELTKTANLFSPRLSRPLPLLTAALTSIAREAALFVLCLLCAVSPAMISAQPAPEWIQRYNGPGHGHDGAAAVAVDRSGNVVVSGTSVGMGQCSEYATIAYSPAGLLLWTNRYRSAVDRDSALCAMAISDSGNVYVTGYSPNSTNMNFPDLDFVTIAYSGAGLPLWTNRLHGPTFGLGDSLALDTAGNVLIAGPARASNDQDNEYCVVKYSAQGLALWTNRCTGPKPGNAYPGGIVADQEGNVFVTGRADTYFSSESLTVAYSPAGVPLWTNHFDTPADEATGAIAVDNSGNVFVAGFNSLNGDDYLIIKYSGAGTPLWTNRYSHNPYGYPDVADAIAVDGKGNVVVTGYSHNGGSYDYATIKYSGAGVPLWTNRYAGQSYLEDVPYSVVTDAIGNVFVTGRAWTGMSYDYATIKYSASGVAVWTNRYDGPNTADDWAHRLAIGPNGDLYVTGSSGNYLVAPEYYFTTIKYPAVAVMSPRLNSQLVGGHLVLTWTHPGFNLQCASSIRGIYTNVVGATSPYTNLASGSELYFRLKWN